MPGAWIFPGQIFRYPVRLYKCRTWVTLKGEPSGKIVRGNNDRRYEAACSTSYGLEVNSDLSLNLPVNRMS